MEETVDISSDGPITLMGDKYDAALYLKGVPIQFTWIREIGSTWRYQIAKSISEQDVIQDRSFSNFVKYGFLSSTPLSQQFEYIINKLGQGQYSLRIDYLLDELYSVEFTEAADDYIHYDTYAGIEDIIDTQAYFSEEVVAEYENLIKKGTEPIMIVLTLKRSENKFILDGHHKFAAYSRLKKNPKALIITKLDVQPISKEAGIELMRRCKSNNQEYKNRFLQKYK